MPGSLFPTTRRSVIEALGSEDVEERERAFETLAAIYWKPLYKYARLTQPPDRSEDLVQSFLLQAFERDALSAYDPRRASFRTFLRLLFDRAAANQTIAERRLKRGGAAAHVDFVQAEEEIARAGAASGDPEEYFRREWVRSVLAAAVERCRHALDPMSFEIFEAYDLAGDDQLTYAELARRLGVNETTITNRLAGARRRFREIAFELLREVTASDHEFRAEVRALFGVEP